MHYLDHYSLLSLLGFHFSTISPPSGASHTSSMAENPPPSSNMAIARSVFTKITETVDNFKLHALPLLSLYEQWKSVQSSFAMVEASMESRAKKLETDERKIESLLSEIRVREERLKVEATSLSEKWNKVEVKEESVKECWEVIQAKNKEIEERLIGLGKRDTDYNDRLKILEYNEKVVDDALDVKEKELEVKKSRLSEELRVCEWRRKEIEEECRCLEAKEEGVMERCVVLEVREKEMREEIEVLELKKKRMVEEFTALEEKERRVEESCRSLEARVKEIEEQSRVQELRGKEMRELGEALEIRAKEIVEGRRVLEERKKGMVGTSRGLEGREKELDERSKEVELRENRITERENVLSVKEKALIELERKLELKEKDINKGFQACSEELRLKKDQLVKSHRVLGEKESEIVEKCKEVELKQERMNEQWKVLEVKEKEISCRLRAVELKEKEMNDKQVNEDVAETKTAMLMKKCSNLFKQADEVLKKQYAEVKVVEDGCNVAGVKEEISENPKADNLEVTGVVASSLYAEIQMVFRNDGAGATASYLTEHAETVSLWQKNFLPLSEEMKKEITGLLESLIAEHKHLQAAMCTCVFEMKDAYPPDFLLEAHLEHVRQRAKDIVQKGGGTAQDDAANMELNALRNVLQCTSNFKLESIYPPAPCELRITQLEKEMEVRRKPTKFLLKKKTNCDLGPNLKASESTILTKMSPTPNLSVANSDSHPMKKRKASASSSVTQNKHHRYHV